MTDNLTLGTKAFICNDYAKASDYFSKLITSTQATDKVLGYLYRGTVFIETENYAKAIEDFEEGLKLNANSFELKFKLGIALFKNGQFDKADQSFRNALISSTNSEEREKLVLWQNKSLIELENQKKELQKKIDNIKFSNNWYQTETTLVVTLDCNKLIKKDITSVVFQKRSFSVLVDGLSVHEVILSNAINEKASTFKLLTQKIELTLVKDVSGFQWITLDAKSAAEVQKYPSSCTAKVDFNKVNSKFSAEFNDEKPEGNDAMMKLFKEIYANANEETRRAMMKSYATSGGTVLSTNWGEVKEKDYAGKDRPTAPEGQMWADEKK